MQLSPSDVFAKIIAGEKVTILDVRSRWEFARGHVPGAIHIPFWRITSGASEIHNVVEHPLVVYCGRGPRAWYAAAVLRRRGFGRLFYLDGHMARWRREKLPEER